MASTIKKEKLEVIIQRDLTHIISQEMKDNKLGFVTITEVRLTNDLSIATVYVNFLGQDNREQAGLETLEKSKGFLRSMLAKKLEIRKVPELKFTIDTSLAEGNKIDNLIKEINKEK